MAMVSRPFVRGCALYVVAAISTPALAQHQPAESGRLQGPYLGQKVPGLVPEFFAEGFVNTPMGMHGNIVFSPDMKAAFWHPDEPIGLYFSEVRQGVWTEPVELSFVENEMHDAPCLSHDGRRLYFSAGPLGPSGKTERSRFYYVDKTDGGWSEAHLLDSVFNLFKIHWQFSVDRDGNLFFGGKQEGNDEKAEIYFSKYENGRYATPVKLPETINTADAEFSPCIAPDSSYLIFGRAVFPPQARPKFLLYVSFRDNDAGWTEAVCLSDVLASKGWDLNCKISPDGKYLFFMSMRDGRNGTFWVDAAVMDQLR